MNFYCQKCEPGGQPFKRQTDTDIGAFCRRCHERVYVSRQPAGRVKLTSSRWNEIKKHTNFKEN